MRRKSLDKSVCALARSLDQVGEWWSLLIIRDVSMGKHRFCELLESLGVARNMLSARLKRLLACGILELRPAGRGPYQEYELTQKGRELLVALVALEQWGSRWTPCEDQTPLVRVERATGEEIARLELRSRDGRTLSAADTAITRFSNARVSQITPATRSFTKRSSEKRKPQLSSAGYKTARSAESDVIKDGETFGV